MTDRVGALDEVTPPGSASKQFAPTPKVGAVASGSSPTPPVPDIRTVPLMPRRVP